MSKRSSREDESISERAQKKRFPSAPLSNMVKKMCRENVGGDKDVCHGCRWTSNNFGLHSRVTRV